MTTTKTTAAAIRTGDTLVGGIGQRRTVVTNVREGGYRRITLADGYVITPRVNAWLRVVAA